MERGCDTITRMITMERGCDKLKKMIYRKRVVIR